MLTKLRRLLPSRRRFASLRWRLLITFGLLILLPVLLTGLLTWSLTADRFRVFVSEENKAQARRIAPLLEASYLLHNGWQDVKKLWRKTPPTTGQTNNALPSDNQWYSDVDWLQVAAQFLAMTPDFLWTEYYYARTMTAVAEQYGNSADAISKALFQAEQEAAAAAVAAGRLAPAKQQEYLDLMQEQIRTFLDSRAYSTGVDRNTILAQKLGLTKDALRQSLLDRTLAEVAQAHHVQRQQLAQAVIDAELANLQSDRFSGDDAILLLSEVFGWLEQYWGQAAPADAARATTEQTGLLSYYLQGNERVLLFAQDGSLKYDSAGPEQRADGQAGLIQQGVQLYRQPTDELIGTLVITSGTNDYSNQQQAFLRSATYFLLISGIVAVLIALMTAFLFARRIIAPVTALTDAVQQIAGGDTDARLPVTTQDELGQMSATFNQMAEALATQRTLRQRLVNDLSHELGTPLSVIQLEMQALRDGLQTPAQAFVQVQSEIELLRNLVRDLSNLETIDNSHFPLQCEPVDLLALTQRASKRWQAKAESKGVTLTLTAPTDLLPLTEADPARLTQVLGNLIDNALRHTTEGGAITVTCQVAPLASLALPPAYRPLPTPPAAGLVVTVSDTGCGIPAADLPHLFERFYRVDSSRNRQSGGRGLGLAIVRQIINAHGGHVWAHSVEGQGSSFGFWLPITEIE
ncbi:MAG: HAMP domain-containing protein [Caldilinea sp. CFX5]|nr:HAMP domain-containing protein [Caldilinea sp. CFX5]